MKPEAHPSLLMLLMRDRGFQRAVSCVAIVAPEGSLPPAPFHAGAASWGDKQHLTRSPSHFSYLRFVPSPEASVGAS